VTLGTYSIEGMMNKTVVNRALHCGIYLIPTDKSPPPLIVIIMQRGLREEPFYRPCHRGGNLPVDRGKRQGVSREGKRELKGFI